MSQFDLKTYLKARQDLVNQDLERRLLSLPPALASLREAMAYSLMAGGKRLRPILCLAGAELAGAEAVSVLPAACALEFIHTYSLIHDDLPALDDDDLRRGRPTCHKVFGEALALLADQARTHDPGAVVEVIRLLARAAGADGMVGGQVADLLAEKTPSPTRAEVEFIHGRKTGALITASLLAGATLAGMAPEDLAALERYGRNVGAAFQIADDLLNDEGDPEILGKPVKSDAARGKATFPKAVGKDGARKAAADMVGRARAELERFGPKAEPLRALAGYIIKRDR